MADKFASWADSVGNPARAAVAVTPADSDLAGGPCKALYVGGAGDLVVILADDSAAVTIKSAGVGYHPLRARQVKAATAATNIVALY